MMNFLDAHALLQQIAEGRYNSISYSVTTIGDGQSEQSCRLYLDQGIVVDGDTWESSFEKLGNELKGEATIIVDNQELSIMCDCKESPKELDPKYFKFVIISDDSELVEVEDVGTNTEIRIKRSDIPLLISNLQNFHHA